MSTAIKNGLERPLPWDKHAESSVLGAVLIQADTESAGRSALRAAVKAKLVAENFFLDQNRRIFQAMLELDEQDKPSDLITLADHLRRSGELETCGGAAYLARLVDGIPAVTNIEHYARIIREKSVLRSLIHTAHNIQQQAFHEEESVAALITRAVGAMIELGVEAEPEEDESTYRDASIQLVQELESPSKKVRAITGIESLDKLTGGFCGGELVILTASITGVGKSLFAEGTRRATCAAGGHGLYCSGEMTATHLVGRGLASAAGVKHKRVRCPERLTVVDKQNLREAAMEECPFCTILYGDLSLAKIRMAAHRLEAKQGPLSVVVVDYDELVSAPGKDEIDQQRNLVRGLKMLAMVMDCPVILVSQLRKALTPGEMKKPSLERIYGTGAKSKHSSLVVFVDRPWVRELKGNRTDATIYVLKNRDGEKGQLPALFNVEKLKFEGLLPTDAQMAMGIEET